MADEEITSEDAKSEIADEVDSSALEAAADGAAAASEGSGRGN